MFSMIGRAWVVAMAASVLAACGGGGGSTPQPPPTPAPSGLSYSTPQSYPVGQAITALSPTVTGTVTAYAVAPALPAGLSLNTTTGVIAGTPTAITAKADYTVTASNSAGSTAATVSITVTDIAPAVSYPGGANYTYTVGDPGEPVVPVNNGGSATSWSITPALPAGLAFNTSNGSITGTPTAVSASAQYTVAAQNSGGTSTQLIVVQVQTGLALQLGHNAPVILMRLTATRAASQDDNGHWVLWDYASGNIISHGHSSHCGEMNTCFPYILPIDLAGSLFVIGRPSGFEVYSATDGTFLWQLNAADSWWKLAPDGSYVAAGNASGLYVYSASGQRLFMKAGDYHQAQAFASPTAVEVAQGAAGANVIENVAVPTGTSTVTPTFNGTFSQWFADGGHFVSTLGTTSWVYSKDGAQQEIDSLAIIGGWGNLFWSAGGGQLYLYTIGNSASPAFAFPLPAGSTTIDQSGAQLGLLSSGSTAFSIINVSAATPTKKDYALPLVGAIHFGTLSASQWAIGMQQGVLIDGASLSVTPFGAPATPRYLGIGAVEAVAGSTNRFVVSTATGKLLLFDTVTSTLQGQLNVFAGQLSLSADGSRLAVGAIAPDQTSTAETLSLPSGAVLATSTHPGASSVVLSDSGTTFGQVSNDGRHVFPATGGADIFSDVPAASTALRLSPDGSLIAAPTGDLVNTTTTKIYNAGALSTAVPGWAVGWLDDSRLLVNKYNPLAMLGQNTYAGASIYSSTGTLLSTSPVTELHQFQVVDADHVYSPETNTILSISTGAVSWHSINVYTPDHFYAFPVSSGMGALAGTKVVFVSDTLVRAEIH